MPTLCAAIFLNSSTLLLVVHHAHHRDEADEFVEIGALNGIFVLGRSMGFIGESLCAAMVMYARWQTLLPCTTINPPFFFSPQDTTWTRRG